MQAITATLAAGLKLPQDWGVIVTDIDEESPASHAGLQPGDIVKSIDFLPIDSLPNTPRSSTCIRGASHSAWKYYAMANPSYYPWNQSMRRRRSTIYPT